MPSPPKKGSAGRKILDCLEGSEKGLTPLEIERVCGTIKNMAVRLRELADKGFIEVTGKREVEGIKGEVWERHNVKQKARKKRLRPGKVPIQELEPYECPACGKKIGMILPLPEHGGGCIYVELQRRIVVFDGPWIKIKFTDPDTEEEKTDLIPKEPLTVFEEWSGKLVVGRAATKEEKEHFASYHKVRGKPWTIGFEGHLNYCKSLNRWFSGKADEKRRTWDTKWDPNKKMFAFKKPDDTPKKSMMDEITDIPKDD